LHQAYSIVKLSKPIKW